MTEQQPEQPGGVWMAYWSDNSGAPVPFATELDALRYAIDRMMHVRFAPFGDDDWMRR